MASVNTNAAAITALRTLQQTNASLDKTQNKISTGYKIGEAKDNAAYWAISTTLKSDNKSLSTVKDALGLGASTVDTAYQGLNKAKDVLDEIKSKLTAATQDGVNRDTIQDEITQLQDQLKSIATSSIFSGENWLQVDSSVNGFNPEKQVVASFSRNGNGSVSIGTIKVQTASVALFDASTSATAGGILDGKTSLKVGGRDLDIGGVNSASGNTNKAGLGAALDTGTSAVAVSATGTAGTYSSVTFGSYTPLAGNATDFQNGDTTAVFTFSLSVVSDGGTAVTKTVVLTRDNLFDANNDGAGGTLSIDELVSAFNTKALNTDKLVAYNDSGAFKIRHADAGGLNTVAAVSGTNAIVVTAGSTATSLGGLTAAPITAAYTTGAGEAVAQTGTVTLTGLETTDKLDMTFKFEGTEYKFAIDPISQGGTGAQSLQKIADALNAASTASSTTFASLGKATVDNGKLVITGKGVGTDQTAELTSVVYKSSTNVVKEPTTATGLPYAEQAKVSTTAFTGVTLDADDKIQFDLKLNGAKTSTLVTIDKALVMKALSNTTGTISTATQYATVLNRALTDAKVTGLTAAANGNTVDLTTTLKDATAQIAISNVTATKGASEISVDTIDISEATLTKLGATSSDQIKQVLTAYIETVNTAITKVTSAAASLGSVASRIDLQKSFVDTLMDTIDKGVGNLVDADMSEESTKLQALQVKQQLGVQALSIANQASQSILSLFRG